MGHTDAPWMGALLKGDICQPIVKYSHCAKVGGDVALCQITLTTCLLYSLCGQPDSASNKAVKDLLVGELLKVCLFARSWLSRHPDLWHRWWLSVRWRCVILDRVWTWAQISLHMLMRWRSSSRRPAVARSPSSATSSRATVSHHAPSRPYMLLHWVVADCNIM